MRVLDNPPSPPDSHPGPTPAAVASRVVAVLQYAGLGRNPSRTAGITSTLLLVFEDGTDLLGSMTRSPGRKSASRSCCGRTTISSWRRSGRPSFPTRTGSSRFQAVETYVVFIETRPAISLSWIREFPFLGPGGPVRRRECGC
jgi:hypothetical protein